MEKLSPNQLHVLYEDPIYVLDKSINPEKPVEVDNEQADEEVINYKGGFDKKVLVLVQLQNGADIAPDDEAFLLKIMSAVNLSLTDIAIMNTEVSSAWQESLNPDLVLGFGLSSTPIDLYSIQKLDNATHFYADNLSTIADNVALKRQLWESLKKMFP